MMMMAAKDAHVAAKSKRQKKVESNVPALSISHHLKNRAGFPYYLNKVHKVARTMTRS